MRRAAVVLIGAYVLLVGAWVLGNPPFAAPDEPAQYIRGLALAGGHGGEAPTYPQPAGTFEEAGFRRLTRIEDAPADLAPPGQLPCFAFDRRAAADCDPAGGPFSLTADERLGLDPANGFFPMIARLDAVEGPDGPELRTTSYMGVYPPALLAVPGATARLGRSPESGVLWGRVGAAAVCSALMAAGWAWLLGGGGTRGPRVAGGLLALTPMALFLAATVSASGVEVAAAFAWVCGLLRAARGPVSGRSLVALGVAGAIVTTARQIGPGWLALSVVAVVACGGLPVARRRVAEHPAAAGVAGALLVGALAFATWWTFAVYTGSPAITEERTTSGLVGQSVGDLGRLLTETVGVFGWLDAHPPLVVSLAWAVLVTAVVAVACLIGRRADRWVLAAVGAGVVVVAVGLSALAYRQQGGAQGRWLLPVAVALPLVAGHLASRRWASPDVGVPRPAAAVVGCAVVVAAIHAVCLWANARRYAVGSDGPLWFPADSRWTPPGGWWPVVALAVAGMAALVAGTSLAVAADRSVGPDLPARADAPAGNDADAATGAASGVS